MPEESSFHYQLILGTLLAAGKIRARPYFSSILVLTLEILCRKRASTQHLPTVEGGKGKKI